MIGIFIKWFVFAIVDFLFTAQCYITNPIAVLFADEYGWLPHILRWWQTWDNTLDVGWYVKDKMPSFLRYDYDKHYIYHTENHSENIAGYVDIIDDHFTLWERIQRYFCRCGWLYRNTGYGFSYEVTGVDVNGADIQKLKDYTPDGYKFYITDYAWVLRYNGKSFGTHHWKIFLGWKLQDVHPDQTRRCMLAELINPFK